MNGFMLDEERLRKYFYGEYSKKDEEYVNDLFIDNKNERELKSFLSKQFDEILAEDEIEDYDLDHIRYRINEDVNYRKKSRKVALFDSVIKWGLRIAGIIVIPFLIYSGIRTARESSLKKETWVEIKAPAWTRAHFSLPDGTTGWLNSNSSVSYNGNFSLDRKVTLNGEAFFDVLKDDRRPFIVKTNEVSVKVLGTRFNIASYDNEKDIEVVLEEGSLIFNVSSTHKSYTMVPNDLITYDKTEQDFSTLKVQPQKYLSWTEGRLEFRNDPMDVVFRRLERWYNIEIESKVDWKEDPRLRATFVDEGFEEVLDLLRRSLHVDYQIIYGNLQPDGTYNKTLVKINPLKR